MRGPGYLREGVITSCWRDHTWVFGVLRLEAEGDGGVSRDISGEGPQKLGLGAAAPPRKAGRPTCPHLHFN